jgi:hypothetical protein
MLAPACEYCHSSCSKLGAVLAYEVEHEAALFARSQSKAATDLLLEKHGALSGPQE